MLIKDLKNVKDEEITLLDVKRAEEIIARANALLGKKTECHHWHGWVSSYVHTPYNPVFYNTAGSNGQTLLMGEGTNITTAANALKVTG